MRFYCFAAALLVSRLLVAQTTSMPIIPVIGTVKATSGDQITVESGQRIITVFTNERTEVWKGKTTHDLSLVQLGDHFSARCRADSSGRIVAENISLNLVNFFGVVTAVENASETFELFTNPGAGPNSAYIQKTLAVLVDADTLFDASAKGDLKVGRGLQMVGVDLKNGKTRATRVTVYEGKLPVRMGGGKVMPITGPAK